MQNFQAFIIILLATMFLSCEKELEYELPQDGTKLTVYSYFYHDMLSFYEVEIHVSLSASIFERAPTYHVPDANVFLFENGIFLDTIHYDTTIFCFYERKVTKPGNHYKILVRNEGVPEASGEFYYPQPVPVTSALWDTTTNEVTFTFDDKPGKDYYSFHIMAKVGQATHTRFPFYKTDPSIYFFETEEFDSLLVYTPENFENQGFDGFFDDKGFDGKKREITVKLFSSDNFPVSEVSVTLNHISPDMYEYKRTLSAYMATKDNPFAEPVKIHSNIHNGYGIVGAATPTTLEAVKK